MLFLLNLPNLNCSITFFVQVIAPLLVHVTVAQLLFEYFQFEAIKFVGYFSLFNMCFYSELCCSLLQSAASVPEFWFADLYSA